MNNSFTESIGSKALFWGVLNLILVAVLVIVWKILILGLPVLPERATITVSGEGESVAIPDITRISFSVVTEGKDPAAIQKTNTEKMNAAIEFVKSQGVSKEDIKTANYSLYPRYDYVRDGSEIYSPGKQILVGYTITQTVNVKIRNAEKVSPILAALPTKGINQIESVSFEVDEPETYLNAAREEAFEKARAKADAMAKANGVRVRRVVTFSESTGGYPMPYYAMDAAFGKGGGPESMPTPPQIEPGSQDITVNVSVTYEIR